MKCTEKKLDDLENAMLSCLLLTVESDFKIYLKILPSDLHVFHSVCVFACMCSAE